MVKGAPEVLIKKCKFLKIGSKERTLNEEYLASLKVKFSPNMCRKYTRNSVMRAVASSVWHKPGSARRSNANST